MTWISSPSAINSAPFDEKVTSGHFHPISHAMYLAIISVLLAVCFSSSVNTTVK